MMKFTKIIAQFLIATMVSMMLFPLQAVANTEGEMTLHEFLKTTDMNKVEAGYKYPSMKISDASGGKSLLPAHTPITIRCVQTISTRDIVSGGTVDFAVVSDIKDNSGNVLIKSGTPVTANISFAKDKGMIGRSGEVTVNDFHTTAVDGTYVPLSGSVSARPDDKMTLSIVLSVLICPLFLLMKGDEARLEAGMTKSAYTVVDTYVKAVRL